MLCAIETDGENSRNQHAPFVVSDLVWSNFDKLMSLFRFYRQSNGQQLSLLYAIKSSQITFSSRFFIRVNGLFLCICKCFMYKFVCDFIANNVFFYSFTRLPVNFQFSVHCML